MAFFQQLPQSPQGRLSEQLGKSLGQGLGKRLGLAEAEKFAENAEQDPVKLAFALARASNYAPELQRSLGQIYEQLLSRTGAYQKGLGLSQAQTNEEKQFTNEPQIQDEISPSGNIPNSMDVPSNTPQNRIIAQEAPKLPKEPKYSEQNIIDLSNEYVAQMRPDLLMGSKNFSPVPTFNFEQKMALRPEEEAQIRQKLSNKKYIPSAIDHVINQINKDIGTRFNEAEKFYNYEKDYKQMAEQKWDKFNEQSNQVLPSLIGGYLPKAQQDLRNKYFQYANQLPVTLTPQAMHDQTSQLLQRDMNMINDIKQIPSVPYIRSAGDLDSYLDRIKNAYAPLLKEGFYETLKEDAILNKDLGIEEMHYAIWGDQTDKESLNNISSVKVPQQYSLGREGSVTMINPQWKKEKPKYIDNLANQLSKIKPDDDLLLLRGQLLANGGTEAQFYEALQLAQDEKKLELSPFQKSQLSEVQVPRIKPIWEIFSPQTWMNWQNRLRGKK